MAPRYPAEDGHKRCTACGEVKPLAGFYVAARQADGFSSACRTCRSAYHKQRYANRTAEDVEKARKSARRARLRKMADPAKREQMRAERRDYYWSHLEQERKRQREAWARERESAKATKAAADAVKLPVTAHSVRCAKCLATKPITDFADAKAWRRVCVSCEPAPVRRVCKTCKQDRPLHQFARSRQGRAWICIDCSDEVEAAA